MLPLFAYGTLRDPEYQRELFDRVFPQRPAEVRDYVVVSTGGGYLAAAFRPGAEITGSLVELDSAAYAIADAWEDRTIYDQIEVTASSGAGRSERCFMYVRPAAAGPAVKDGRLSDRSRAEVIGDIRQFRASVSFPH
jgi:gamma-glutamylcyclotransferase (GGCT)/AIG2-like uncharacterized protein YtfP